MTDRMSAAAYLTLVAKKNRPARTHKYGAVPRRVDGHHFASTFEAQRYGQLRMLERGGRIKSLQLQPRFELRAEGADVGTYVGDFSYYEVERPAVLVVEDVKGVETALYKLKRAIFLAQHPEIDFREIKRK